ncbi:MAG: hypothetical protein WCG83_00540 [Candidatus Peregrinibacteria bacterium]
MRKHPSLFGEQRLLFFVEVPKAQVEEMKDVAGKAEKQLLAGLPDKPELAIQIQQFKIDAAENDGAKLKASFEAGMKSLAQALFDKDKASASTVAELTSLAARVQGKMEASNAPVTLNVDAVTKNLTIGVGEVRYLTPETAKMIEDNLPGCPEDMLRAIKEAAKEAVPGSRILEGFTNFSAAMRAIPLEHRVLALLVLTGKKESRDIKDTAIQGKVDSFVAYCKGDTGVQQLMKKVRGKFMLIKGEENAEKRKDSDAKIPGHALGLCKNFDEKPNPTQADKNLMLAKLMMAGVDVSNEAAVFDKKLSPEARFPPLQGDAFDLALNKAMGALSFLANLYEQVQGVVQKPGEKKKEAAAAKAAESAGSAPEDATVTAQRTKLLGEMKVAPGTSVDAYIAAKEGLQGTKQREVAGKEGDVVTKKGLAAAASATPADTAALATAEATLSKAQKELKELTTDVDQLKLMKTGAEQSNKDIRENVDALRTLLATDLVKDREGASALAEFLKGLGCSLILPVGLELKISASGGVPSLVNMGKFNNVVLSQLKKDPGGVITFDALGNVTSKPEDFASALKSLRAHYIAESAKPK